MTRINDLPMDLVEEILSRVPLKSMITVRFTCKKWNRLSKSESFAKMHISKSALEEEFQMVLMKDYNLYLVSVFVNDLTAKFLGKFTCLDLQVKISEVYHCEGLLLCILKEDDTKVVVWNPYLGQTRCIESRYPHRPNGIDRFSYALGYEDKKSCRSYKFLRFIDDVYSGRPEDQFYWYEIYDFDSGIWTILDVNPYWRIYYYCHGVSLKGNTYWLASQRNSEDGFNNHIICFDFTSERFGPLLHLPFYAGVYKFVKLSCVKEEKLVVLLQDIEVNPYEHEIWITTKIEAENVSWSKFLTLNTAPVPYPISGANFFIDEEKKVAMGFYEKGSSDLCTLSIIGEAGYLTKLDLGKHAKIWWWNANACSYVPSLAQIQESAGDKRKQQSDLEKHRFDDHRSRLSALTKRVRR